MNKGSLVSWHGHGYIGGKCSNFTRKKIYKVVAGLGDGVPRNDGTLGAFITSETQFVVEDDYGNLRVQSIGSSNWKLIRAASSNYKPKPEAASPIVHGHHVSMNVLVQNAVVSQGELSEGDKFGHG